MTAVEPVGVHRMEELLFLVLAQLVVIIGAARLAGHAAIRIAQTRVVGEIVVGLLLGPTLFGALWPDASAALFRPEATAAITVLSQVGLILLMFQIGLEFDFAHLLARDNRSAVLKVAGVGLVLPFALVLYFAWASRAILAPTLAPGAYSLFLGTAFAISAAALDDVVGGLLRAAVTTIVTSRFDPMTFTLQVFALGVYAAGCWWGVRPVLHRLLARHSFADGALPHDVIGLVLAAVFLSAMAPYALGVFAIFGGFVLGVLLHDQADFVAAWRTRIGHFVTVFFLPIFFTYTGLRTDVGALDAPLWGWAVLLLALATAGKFVGCYMAARWAGLDRAESRIIGTMMNTRALMELVVVNVGFDLGIIPPAVFTMLVVMAIASTVITTPLLKRWLPAAQLSARHQAE